MRHDTDVLVSISHNLDALPQDTDTDGIDDTLEDDRLPYMHFINRYLPDRDGEG